MVAKYMVIHGVVSAGAGACAQRDDG